MNYASVPWCHFLHRAVPCVQLHRHHGGERRLVFVLGYFGRKYFVEHSHQRVVWPQVAARPLILGVNPLAPQLGLVSFCI